MQNHLPYFVPKFDNSDLRDPMQHEDEYAGYLDGIIKTDEAIEQLKAELENIGEKCIVIFIGDHFPFFSSDHSIYDELGINAQNSSILYEQRYFIWANFDLDMQAFDKHDKISLFYIPHMIAKLQGLPKNQISNTVLGEIDNSPVYTQFFDQSTPSNETLDMLSYDLILGERFAVQ
jgi:hypothetical protein